MLNRKNNIVNAKDNKVWTDYYSKRALDRVGVNGKLPFTVVSMDAEPEKAWDSKTRRYDGQVTGWTIWVVQNAKDGQNTYVQNPIPVTVDSPIKPKVTFADKVVFDTILAYYSKRRYVYKFRCKAVKKIDD